MTGPLERALRASVDRVTTGIVITDPDGVPQHWNEFMEELLKLHREFRILADQIQVADAKEHQQLRWLMRKCAEHGESQHMVCRCKGAVDPLFIAVEALPWEQEEGPFACLLLIRSPAATGTLDPVRLASLFELSTRESELVAALADGRGLDEFAGETERSIHTVRTQLKSIYRKTGTQRQADLVRLVLTSTAFLHRPSE
jgi:DNA-binding CsgD family transcriptional regulator